MAWVGTGVLPLVAPRQSADSVDTRQGGCGPGRPWWQRGQESALWLYAHAHLDVNCFVDGPFRKTGRRRTGIVTHTLTLHTPSLHMLYLWIDAPCCPVITRSWCPLVSLSLPTRLKFTSEWNWPWLHAALQALVRVVRSGSQGFHDD